MINQNGFTSRLVAYKDYSNTSRENKHNFQKITRNDNPLSFALVFGQFLVEVSVGEQTSLENRDSSGDAAFGDNHLFLIEAGYVASQGFRSVLEDFVEAVRSFPQVPAAGELLHKFVTENREGGYGPGGQIDIPLQSGSGQGGAETFAHGSFT